MSVALKEKISLIFDELTNETQAEVIDFAEFLKQKKLNPATNGKNNKRIFGMHEGQGWMSDDFTAPLPDSFWLGEDIEVPK
jgi:Protein of unknown function (DUF2281)